MAFTTLVTHSGDRLAAKGARQRQTRMRKPKTSIPKPRTPSSRASAIFRLPLAKLFKSRSMRIRDFELACIIKTMTWPGSIWDGIGDLLNTNI